MSEAKTVQNSKFEIRTSKQHIEKNTYEAELTVKVTSETNGQKAFECEFVQAGLFICEGFTEKQQKFLLNASAPNVLYAYARKTEVSRGRTKCATSAEEVCDVIV